ncbi:hypothetical protein HS088_TW04G01182 [Tripterygium wilfordii]|uniref:Uncharacterized protein n=1 Tax=Tripterygium wilfordii TaxID=458696 RepID=A0A7J7DS72_TRIWF|nr:hypothetical protein HS088_TW04G01182 [Tripterygium wilfordii]
MDEKEVTSSFVQKHGLPANSTNLEMAGRLTSLLKGTDELTSRGQSCSINGLGETASEKEAIDEIRKFKKVRFNPDIEVRHYVVSVKRRGRRRSMVKKPAKENPVKLSEDTVDNTRRITRSRLSSTKCR